MRCCAGPGPRGGGALTTLLLTGRSRRRLSAESGRGPRPGRIAWRLRLYRSPFPAGRRGYGSPRGRSARPVAAEAGGGLAVPAAEPGPGAEALRCRVAPCRERRRCLLGLGRRSAPSCPAHRAAFHVPSRPSELFSSPSA